MCCTWLDSILVADANYGNPVLLADLLPSHVDTHHVPELVHTQHFSVPFLELCRQPVSAVYCVGCIHGSNMQELGPQVESSVTGDEPSSGVC